ncbi:hypothetical protein ABIF74_009883 [Bradyrhizobium japonicum]
MNSITLPFAQIDEMVVMAVAHRLVARAALAEIMALDDAGILEQLDGAIHGRDRDLVVDGDAAPVQFLDVGVVDRFRQHAGDDTALLGHAHAGGGAASLDAGRLGGGGRFKSSHSVSA